MFGGGIGIGECFGTCPKIIEQAIEAANQGDGVVILCDLGSSVINARKAQESIGNRIRVEIVDAPLVEGTIVAVSANHPKVKMENLIDYIKESKEFPKR